MADPMQLYDVAGACALLRCGRTKLYQLVRQGKLRAAKIGKLTRFTRRELERLIDRGTRGA